MKLKNILNEAPIQRAKVDYSTMDLKSNINQKWLSFQDMMEDLNQWLSASLDGVPDAEITRVGKDLRDLGMEMIRRKEVHGTTRRGGRPSFSDFQKGDRKGI
jgi:hypothetical protein